MTTAATRRPAAEIHSDAVRANPFPLKLHLPHDVVAAGSAACAAWCIDLTLANPDFPCQIELNVNGELELTMPPYYPADAQEGETYGALHIWNVANGRPGYATTATGAYLLPNGAIRYPDAAWTATLNTRLDAIGPGSPRPYCPDFVVEIRSTSQSRPSDLTELLNKMQEYMDNGAKLGWFIDPIERTVRIYRAGADEPELLADPETLDGEDVLPGFVFEVRKLIFYLV